MPEAADLVSARQSDRDTTTKERRTHAKVDILAVCDALHLHTEFLEVEHLHPGLVRARREEVFPIPRRLDLVARLGKVKVLSSHPVRRARLPASSKTVL